VAVQVLTWSDLSSGERSDRVILLLVAAAFLAAVLGPKIVTRSGHGEQRPTGSDSDSDSN
jgi:hypothetical protein